MKEKHIIDIRDKNERDKLIEQLLDKGFKFENYNKEEIINGTFPIVVDIKAKIVSMIGNMTCAAASVSVLENDIEELMEQLII